MVGPRQGDPAALRCGSGLSLGPCWLSSGKLPLGLRSNLSVIARLHSGVAGIRILQTMEPEGAKKKSVPRRRTFSAALMHLINPVDIGSLPPPDRRPISDEETEEARVAQAELRGCLEPSNSTTAVFAVLSLLWVRGPMQMQLIFLVFFLVRLVCHFLWMSKGRHRTGILFGVGAIAVIVVSAVLRHGW